MISITATANTTPETSQFPGAYIRLRTVLDGLETNALRYCLDDISEGERTTRAAAIEAMIMPIMEFLMLGITGHPPGTCGDGYFNCDGVCVPYKCPNGMMGAAEATFSPEKPREPAL